MGTPRKITEQFPLAFWKIAALDIRCIKRFSARHILYRKSCTFFYASGKKILKILTKCEKTLKPELKFPSQFPCFSIFFRIDPVRMVAFYHAFYVIRHAFPMNGGERGKIKA